MLHLFGILRYPYSRNSASARVVVVIEQGDAGTRGLKNVIVRPMPMVCQPCREAGISAMSQTMTGPSFTKTTRLMGGFSESRTGANSPRMAEPR
jgi:hypothetical protein